MASVLAFAAYLAAAKLSLALAFIHASASAVWPPTGIAIAIFLVLGPRMWPAIFLGAFVANVTTAGSVATSLGIALGNTLEGLLAAGLVTRFAGGRHAFERPEDVVKYAALAGLGSTMVSATIGVTSLAIGGYAAWADYARIWLTWWLGDAVGAIVVAPLLVLWANDPFVRRRDRPMLLEAVLLLGVLVLVGQLVFGGGSSAGARNYPLTYLCLPPLVWAGFRFGPREAATATVLLSALAIWGTLRGLGPFGRETPHEALLLLQTFMGGVALLTLLVAVVVADRNRVLGQEAEARAEADAANRAKDEFLATLGHELRNPLGAITAAVGVLDLIGAKEERAVRSRRIIARQAGHLARMLDDMLDLSRITRGQIALELRPVNLADLLERALGALASRRPLDQHTITLESEPAWAEVDEMRMEQVVANLLDNAVKHTPPGGRIAVSLRADGEWAVLRVEDSGMGIPVDRLPRIFEPFYQGEPSLDRTAGGLGLGLAVVLRLVEQHGGTVTAASEGRGRGSTFTVRLPRVTPLPAPVIAPAVVATTPPPRRVVVIEDNADSREMLDHLLRMAGHEVHDAEDGPGGLEVVARVVPDVVLIDIGLPGLDGYEVARRLRETVAGRSMLLVAMTGYGQPEDRRRALEAGFDDHLVKPIDLGRLEALFARAGRG